MLSFDPSVFGRVIALGGNSVFETVIKMIVFA